MDWWKCFPCYTKINNQWSMSVPHFKILIFQYSTSLPCTFVHPLSPHQTLHRCGSWSRWCARSWTFWCRTAHRPDGSPRGGWRLLPQPPSSAWRSLLTRYKATRGRNNGQREELAGGFTALLKKRKKYNTDKLRCCVDALSLGIWLFYFVSKSRDELKKGTEMEMGCRICSKTTSTVFCCLSLVCLTLDPTQTPTSPGCRATSDQTQDFKYRATSRLHISSCCSVCLNVKLKF